MHHQNVVYALQHNKLFVGLDWYIRIEIKMENKQKKNVKVYIICKKMVGDVYL